MVGTAHVYQIYIAATRPRGPCLNPRAGREREPVSASSRAALCTPGHAGSWRAVRWVPNDEPEWRAGPHVPTPRSAP